MRFIEADATALPFEDGEFDVTISNTVQEHIAPERFFGEQHRVLKRGGVCLVLSARRGVNIEADCVAQQSDFERDIWARVSERCRNMDRDLGVGRYAMSERELPQAMEAHGFDNVSTHYIAVNLTPDDPDVSPEAAHAMIDAQRRMRLDAVQSLEQITPDVVGKAELSELEAHVNRRYDERLALYDAGKRQWGRERNRLRWWCAALSGDECFSMMCWQSQGHRFGWRLVGDVKMTSNNSIYTIMSTTGGCSATCARFLCNAGQGSPLYLKHAQPPQHVVQPLQTTKCYATYKSQSLQRAV